MFDWRGYSITAISPGGSVWRATRGAEPPISAIKSFSYLFLINREQLHALPTAHQESITSHALMVWLEKRGVITYSYRASERNRRLFERHADLIRSLTDDRLLP